MQSLAALRDNVKARPLLALFVVAATACFSLPIAGLLLLGGAAVMLWPFVERAQPVAVRVEGALDAARRHALTVVQTVSTSAADAILLEQAVEREAFQARRWGTRAEKAMLAGDDGEARACIEQCQHHQAMQSELTAELERQRAVLARLKPHVEVARAGVERAARQGELLAVRSRRAAATREVVMTASGLETRAGEAAFQRLAADVARQEAEAQALEELLGTTAADEHAARWDRAEREEHIDAELEGLRRRVGLRRAALGSTRFA